MIIGHSPGYLSSVIEALVTTSCPDGYGDIPSFGRRQGVPVYRYDNGFSSVASIARWIPTVTPTETERLVGSDLSSWDM